jgi:YebC/PmpR family DNA-binding regulatory protein
MAGHSHGANIFYRKSAVDNKRGKVFSKIARMIILAARQGGGDPEANLKLRYAIDKARAVSMPKDNIERAIKRGSGELEGVTYEEVTYEGYGAGGVAVMVETLTDNRHRTAPELRKAFEVHAGNLASNGAVSWMFERKAVFRIAKDAAVTEDTLLEAALESGCDDLIRLGEGFEIRGDAGKLTAQRAELEARKVPIQSAEATWVPKNLVEVADADNARRVLALMDVLEDHDDVQNVFANYDIPDAVVAAVQAAEGRK